MPQSFHNCPTPTGKPNLWFTGFSVFLFALHGYGQVSIALVDFAYTQNFNSLASSGNSSTMPAGWVFAETGGDGLYTASSGTSATANTYSFGFIPSSDRAIGEISSASLSTTFGASFANNTGVTITALMIHFTGEQWRLGTSGMNDKLDFQYSLNATSINDGAATWVNFNTLDFNAPVTTGTVGSLDGNLAVNRTEDGAIISSLSISNGNTFWIRWNSSDASSADHGLGIDDFAITANPVADFNFTTGANLTLDELNGVNDIITISESGVAMKFSIANKCFSVNGTGIFPFPTTTNFVAYDLITINTAGGSDIINIDSFVNAMPSLTLNGGTGDDNILINGDITFQLNANFDADLQDDNASPGTDRLSFIANANVSLSGTGSADIKMSRSVEFFANASLETANGAIIIEANQQAAQTTGNFSGIKLATGSRIEVNGSGLMTLKGKGGTTSSTQSGIHLSSGSEISTGTTGTSTFVGVGGSTSGANSRGIFIDNSIISASGGHLSLTGTGSGSGSGSKGIEFDTSTLMMTGTGNVTLIGTGAGGGSGVNSGVDIKSGLLQTSGGNMSITGNGGGSGSGAFNYGIQFYNGAEVMVGGSGDMILNGEGGNGTSGSHIGVLMQGSSEATASGGDIVINGEGGGSGSSTSNHGVSLNNATITLASTGKLTMTGTGGDATGQLNEGVRIFAGSLISGSGGEIEINGTGGVISTFNSKGITVLGTIQNTGIGVIELNGTGGPAVGSGLHGIQLESSAILTSVNGNIVLTGTGGGSNGASACHGVQIASGGTVQSTGTGDIIIAGTGGIGTGDNFYGTSLNANAMLTTANGDIVIDGFGGGAGSTSNGNIGLNFQGGPILTAGGTGNIAMFGVSGNTAGTGSNLGALINNSTLTTTDGDISVYAESNSLATATVGQNHGLFLSTTTLAAGGDGTISIEAHAAHCTSGNNVGLFIQSATNITTNSGDINIEAYGAGNDTTANNNGLRSVQSTIAAGGNGKVTIHGAAGGGTGIKNHGLYFITSSIISSNTGNILLTGVEGNSTTSDGIEINGMSSITTTAADITMLANSMDVQGDITTGVSNKVTLRPYTAATDVELGAMTDGLGGPLRLSDAELDSVFTGTLVIGNSTTGTITVMDTITRTSLTHVQLLSNEDVITNGGFLNANGGSITLDPGNAPMSIQPIQASVELIGAGVTLSGPFEVDIDGTVADVSYTQLNVQGTVTLSGSALITTGSYVPIAGDVFIIIQNDGADAVTGTFTGLPNNAIITNFMNSNLPATITYTGGSGNDVVITVASPHYTVTTSGNHLIVTDIAGNAETMVITQVSASLRFTVATRTYSLNGGAVTSLPVDVAIAGLNSTTIDLGSGSDLLQVNAITTAMPSITINGGAGDDIIQLLDDIAFQGNANLDIDLQDDVATPGADQISILANTVLQLTGTGAAEMKVNRSISMASGSSVQTVNGNITVEANMQATPATGSFSGVALTNAVLQVTGSGVLTVKGKGGTTAAGQNGIHLNSGADLIGGTSGTTIIEGYGGASGSTANLGVSVQGAGTTIQTNGSALQVNGTGGGSGTSAFNYGVSLLSGGSVTTIASALQVTGIGGVGTAGSNVGVRVNGTNSTIQSSFGAISVTGTGMGSGSGNNNYGVEVTSAGKINGLNTATVTVSGTGGMTTGSGNAGIYVANTNSRISAENGNINIQGTGGPDSGLSPHGVFVDVSGGITGSGTSAITIHGTGGISSSSSGRGVAISGGTISTFQGAISITGAGGGSGAAALRIGIHMDGIISSTGNGSISLHGTGGTATGFSQVGVRLLGNAEISTSGAYISIIGQGGNNSAGSLNYGVEFNGADVEATGSCNIIITGTGGNGNGGLNDGIAFSAGANNITTMQGDITLTGVAGSSNSTSGGNGISVASETNITGAGNGMVQLSGTSALNTANLSSGIHLEHNEVTIQSVNGNLSLIGESLSTGTAGFGRGVYISSGVSLLALGTGNILLQGTGSTGSGSFNAGVYIENSSTTVAAFSGDVTLSGTGGGSGNGGSNIGTFISGASVASNTGNVMITGYGGDGSGNGNAGVQLIAALISTQIGDLMLNGIEGEGANGQGMMFAGGVNLSVVTDGNIYLAANSMQLDGMIVTPGSGSTSIYPYTSNTGIELYSVPGNVVGGPLRLSDAELDRVLQGTLIIGNSTAGLIDVKSPISWVNDVQLISGSDVIFSSGSLTAADVLLDPGPSPAAVRPLQPGNEVSCQSLSFGSDLAINIDGTIVDTEYDQLNVIGSVNLSGVSLIVSGTHTPVYSDTFVIVNNDGTDPVTGTFIGLPEGTILNNFLAPGFDAIITYAGSTGNDVVIRMERPDYDISLSAGILTITDISGNSDAMELTQSGGLLAIDAPLRTYSFNGSSVNQMPFLVSLAGVDSVIVNQGAGADQLQIMELSLALPSMVINGGTGNDAIFIHDNLNFINHASFIVDLQNDAPVPGEDFISHGGYILVSGNGSCIMRVSNFIYLDPFAGISAENGDIILEANQQPIASSGSFSGITIDNADCYVTGTGSMQLRGRGGTTGVCHGVNIINGTTLFGGDTDALIIEGHGGVSADNGNIGVRMTGLSLITTTGADIEIEGYGHGAGSAPAQRGVEINASVLINPEEGGSVSIIGIGGTTTGNFHDGVLINSFAEVRTEDGDISITGTGGGSINATGCNGIAVSGEITATGEGAVTLNGTGGMTSGSENAGVRLHGSILTINDGNLSITGTGGGTGFAAFNCGIFTTSGAMMISLGAGNIALQGTGSPGTGDSNKGIHLGGTGIINALATGVITIDGQGGGTSVSGLNYGVHVTEDFTVMSDGNGDITVSGEGGNGTGGDNMGLLISNGNIHGNGADIALSGIAGGSGTGEENHGVYIHSGSSITIDLPGNIAITGTGSNATGIHNAGVLIEGVGTHCITADGDINITGIGGGSGNSAFNVGAGIIVNAAITAGGDGDINIAGTGGSGTAGDNIGVQYEGILTSAMGDVSVSGIEGAGAFSWAVFGMGYIETTSGGGDINISANSLVLYGELTTTQSDSVTIKPYHAGKPIVLGDVTELPAGPLVVEDEEFNLIETGTLIVGHMNADSMNIVHAVVPQNINVLHLVSGDDILFTTGNLQCDDIEVYLHSGNTPQGIKPQYSGADVSCSELTFEEQLLIEINGTTANVDYSQLTVVGAIDFSGSALHCSGLFDPEEGDSFVIISNDGTDPVVGTFLGLAEGDTIFNFLGSELGAVISYSGNDGNDVVLEAVTQCAFPDEPGITATPSVVCEGTQVTLSITSGNLNGATEWHWYAASCGGIAVGTGNSIMVTPAVTTTYFARGEGGCVTAADCGEVTVVVNQFPDPSIERSTSGPCYFTENIFQPEATLIPGATYTWHFGAGAQPPTASGYGPHSVIYTTDSTKTVKLVIYPNTPGTQCPDSSTINFVIDECPGQITGGVFATNGAPVNNVNVKLFADANMDGHPDTTAHIRSVFTPANGLFAMASLLPGNYVLVETQPNLWLSHDDGDATPDGDIVTNSDSLDNIIPVTITINKSDANNEFIERPEPGAITGLVFQDFDLDMQPDPGEGLPGINITLLADANTNGVADNSTPVASAVTNAQGQYNMPNIQVGHYVIVESTPSGMLSIKDFDSSPDGDAVPNSNMNNDTLPVSIINAEVDAGNHFIDAVSGCPLTVTNDNDDGPGSLRDIVGCAEAGDTIQFHPAMAGATIEISSEPIIFENDVVIRSVLSPTITIQSSINDLFFVPAGVIVHMRGIDMISGLSPGPNIGAAIDNHGELLLHDVHIYPNPFLPPGVNLVRNHPGSHLELSGNIIVFQ